MNQELDFIFKKDKKIVYKYNVIYLNDTVKLRVYRILKESEKAILVYINDNNNIEKTSWIPKSMLLSKDEESISESTNFSEIVGRVFNKYIYIPKWLFERLKWKTIFDNSENEINSEVGKQIMKIFT